MPQENTESSSLLGLPNELLLIISGALDNDSLLNLAFTCQRINALLISSIFTRFGFQLPPSFSGALPTLSFTGETLQVLPALAIASSIDSIDAIDCAFPAYNKYVLPKENFAAARALDTGAVRLSHLGHLRINPYVTGHMKKELAAWSQAVATFLGSAARRGGCAITIYSGSKHHFIPDPRPFSHTFRAAPVHGAATASSESSATCLQMLWRALKTLFRFCQWGNDSPTAPELEADSVVIPLTATSTGVPIFESTERVHPVFLPPVAHSVLTTLNAHSSFLFHATFYRWTLHLLATSPLTALSLDNIDLSHYDWALTLPALTLPALTSLSIGQCLISVPELDAFLARHPTICALDLAFHAPIGALLPPTTAYRLPRLTTLRATPDYLLYFLADEAADAWYPHLGLVGVTSNDESAYQVGQFARLVECVSKRRLIPRVEVVGKLAVHCVVPPHLAASGACAI
ncbi:hypothetical protein B0H19DRAFT_579845 [Mycena capillaripes]|nr:hypothetical protein B0H19DRAFT_579845 [Mycena capillaripes]